MAAGARKSGRGTASRSRKCRRPASIRKLVSAIRVEAKALGRAELSFRPFLDHAFGKARARNILAVANLRAPVWAGEDRPVSRCALVVDTVGHPHVEVFIFADEAGVGDALAGISRVIDRAL